MHHRGSWSCRHVLAHRLTNLRRARPRVEMRRRPHEARVLWRWRHLPRHLPRQLRWCRGGLCLFAQAVAEADFQRAPNGLAQLFTCVLEHRIAQLHPVCVQSTIYGVSPAVAEAESGFYAGRVFWQGKAGRPRLAPHLPDDQAPAHPTLPSRHLSERQAASRRSGRPPAACSGWPPAAHNPKWCTIIRVLNSETRTSLTSYQ